MLPSAARGLEAVFSPSTRLAQVRTASLLGAACAALPGYGSPCLVCMQL